ncbi:hypothetical protein CL647_01420 [bacterium]|nr:hypothetical protein [bacterium]|tara:strand:+ start:2566 stop:3477 length:912 start_codon:yes stop_codon:yes gene_type:complete
MNIKSLQHCSSLTFFPKHQPYFEFIRSDVTSHSSFGYAFSYDNQLYCLTPFDNQGDSFPYLILDYTKQYLGLDALLVSCSATCWQAVVKAQFLAQAYQDLGDRKHVLYLMPLMGLVAKQTVLSEYLKMASLPSLLLDYAYRKKVSSKQLLQMVRFDLSFLTWFDSDVLPYIDPSCSVLLDLCESLHDCYQRLGGIHLLVESLQFDSIWESYSDLNKRLSILRDRLFKQRYPTQTYYNQRMKDQIKVLDLPDFMSIDWDKTLENKGFFLNVHVSRLDDLQGLSLLSDKQALFETLLQEMTYDSD